MLATALVLLIHIIRIGDINIFSILDDGFGYWGNAAYLAGLDWSDDKLGLMKRFEKQGIHT